MFRRLTWCRAPLGAQVQVICRGGQTGSVYYRGEMITPQKTLLALQKIMQELLQTLVRRTSPLTKSSTQRRRASRRNSRLLLQVSMHPLCPSPPLCVPQQGPQARKRPQATGKIRRMRSRMTLTYGGNRRVTPRRYCVIGPWGAVFGAGEHGQRLFWLGTVSERNKADCVCGRA